MSHNSLNRLLAATGIAFAAAVTTPLFASDEVPLKLAQAKTSAKTMTEMVDGEVRRVDKAAGKVTLKHGELKELEMPPMTMAFEATNKAMLDAVKPGDKVKFRARDDNGKLLLIELKPAR